MRTLTFDRRLIDALRCLQSRRRDRATGPGGQPRGGRVSAVIVWKAGKMTAHPVGGEAVGRPLIAATIC